MVFAPHLAEIVRLLEAEYGSHTLSPCDDPLKRLILTLLSHRTNREDEHAGFTRMWARYPSWAAVQAADLDGLIAALAPVRFPERKGPYIQQTLRQLHDERGAYSIDFLADLPTAEAMRWLLALPGVGIKTASLVMLFCFHREVMPVDTHVHRVSTRLGVIPPQTSAEKAHGLLLDLLPTDAAYLYNYHRLLFKHGRQTCTYSYPRCRACVLEPLCPASRLR